MTSQNTGKENKSYTQGNSPKTDFPQPEADCGNQREDNNRLQSGMFYKQTI